jgi:GMP synthase (glutamine-hydrolysing)
MPKTALAIRHLAFEDLGSFAFDLRDAGYEIRYCDVGIDDLSGRNIADADLLIVLGGPIGAYEDSRYPFLREELRVITDRLTLRKATLGICLGAQLMARALGAQVYPGPEKEIGFAPICLSEEGRSSCLAALGDAPVLHWHGDTFDLPSGATLLASTDTYRNQAFSCGTYAIAFQFHPEAGGTAFERWLIGHAVELSSAGKDVCALRQNHQRFGPELRRRASVCLSQWLQQL